MSETIKPTNTSPQHSFTSGSSSLTRPMSSSASPVWDEQHQPLSSSSFKRMPPFYVDINQTDKSYKERLASTMASNMSRGLSPAFSMSSAIEKREINLHLIMLVGLVASGKSTLAKAIVRAFGGYVLVSGEWVGSDEDSSWETEWDKCVFAAKAAFSSGMNVISDLPNETPEKRRKWIELAKEYGASIDAIVLDTSIMTCHNRISDIYKVKYGDNSYAVERSQSHHHRLRCVAARYTKPASVEFDGRVIYLPEGVQSSGYWSAEKLRRFLPDVVTLPYEPSINKKATQHDEDVAYDTPGADGKTASTLGSVASLAMTGQTSKGKRNANLFSLKLSAVPPIDTNQDLPSRRGSPNAIAIRASPRRRKRTHERKPTVAISVAEFATKASPPLHTHEERTEAMSKKKNTDLNFETSTFSQDFEGMNELILECPTSPLRSQEEMEARRAFAPVFGFENIQAAPINAQESRQRVATLSPQLSQANTGFEISGDVQPGKIDSPVVLNEAELEEYQSVQYSCSPQQSTFIYMKPSDRAIENCGELCTLPTAVQGENFMGLQGSPTMVGFTADIDIDSVIQRHEPGPKIYCSDALNTSQSEVKIDEYEDFCSQFSKKCRPIQKDLDGCMVPPEYSNITKTDPTGIPEFVSIIPPMFCAIVGESQSCKLADVADVVNEVSGLSSSKAFGRTSLSRRDISRRKTLGGSPVEDNHDEGLFGLKRTNTAE